MKYNKQLEQLKSQLSTVVPDVICHKACENTIEHIVLNESSKHQKDLHKQLFKQFATHIFSRDLSDFLEAYYGESYTWQWPVLDIIDDTALETYYSTTWHCDGGINGMLKVFLYLNSVQEHGCNTLIIDESTSDQLKEMGALPHALDERTTDLSDYLQAFPCKTSITQYDLAAGDLLIFDPLRLAHRCLPPRQNKKRYTICYSVFPKSAFS